jgi:hypothetical protein
MTKNPPRPLIEPSSPEDQKRLDAAAGNVGEIASSEAREAHRREQEKARKRYRELWGNEPSEFGLISG